MNIAELADVLRSESIRLLTANQASPPLGFAWSTDDDCSSLAPLAVFPSATGDDANDDLLGQPWEWSALPLSDTTRSLGEVLYARSVTSSDFSAHVEWTYNLLFKCLQHIRNENLVPERTMLVAFSTGGGELQRQHELRWMKRINSEENFQTWVESL